MMTFNINFISDLYFDESLTKEEVGSIKQKLKEGKDPVKYVIVAFENSENYLEIVRSKQFASKYFENEIRRKGAVTVVGICRTNKKAKELCSLIVEDVLEKYGRIDKADLLEGIQ